MKNLSISIQSVFILLIMVLSIFLATEPVSDNDLWWHIKTGEHILVEQSIPTKDIFSFYGMENNLDWVAHEWLSDIILYKFYDFGGFKGLMFFPLVLLLSTLIVMYITIKPLFQRNYLLGSVWFFSAAFILAMFSSTRPHMFSFLLFSLSTLIVFKFLKDRTKWIWFLPIVSMLWSNLHGGSSTLLFVLLGFTIVSSLLPIRFGRLVPSQLDKKSIFELIAVSIVSVLFAAINPYGFHMIIYPFINMADSTMLSFIVEWFSPDLHTPEGIVTFAVVGMGIVFVLLSNKEIKLLDFLLLAAFAYLTFRSIRQVSYFVIVLTPIIMTFIPERITNNQYKPNLINSVLAFALIVGFTFPLVKAVDKEVDTKEYPKEALQAVMEVKPKHLLNDYNWGGYLIWELHDEGIYPFIDGRADIFSKYTLNDYNEIYMINPKWEETFNKYNFDAVLFPADKSLPNELLKTGDWTVYYKDKTSIFLVKKQDSGK